MKITRRIVLGGLTGMVVLLVLLTYFTSAEREKKISVESTTAGIKRVKTVVAEPQDASLNLSEVGIIKASSQVTVIAESSGKVVELRADVGDRVRKDEIIYVLEDELARCASDEAEAGVIMTEAAFEKARKDYERGEELFDTRDISLNELESLRLVYRNAEGNLLRSKALLAMAKRRHNDTRISSPVKGIITSRDVDVGEMVTQGMPVAVVVDAESVQVTLGITDTDIPLIIRGQRCFLSVDAYPGRRFEGRVKNSSLKADDDSGAFPVKVIAKNTEDLKLRAGMVARVSIETGRLQGVILLPRDAIVARNGQNTAFVVEGDRAVAKALRLGPSIDTEVVVDEGLSTGDRVVVVGVETLTDGEAVMEGK